MIGTAVLDEDRLDDLAALQAVDSSGMLVTVAGSAAQLREAATLAGEAALDRLAEDPRPRSIVVAGMGGSAISGDVAAALLAEGAPTPLHVHRGFGLPPWVGPADVVVAISCSGATEETLSAAEEAIRRGARVIGIGAPDSPLAALVSTGRGSYLDVDVGGRMPRASLWSLCLPLLVAVDRLGVYRLADGDVQAAADALEHVAQRCRPDSESFINPGKSLAIEIAGSLPAIWGTSAVASVAARRFVAQLAENAKYPAVPGVLPEAGHNQLVAFDGPFASVGSEEFFRDRVEDESGSARLRLVLVRDDVEHPRVARRADICAELAEERGIGVSVVTAEGARPLERMASLVGLLDFTSVYLALAFGIDPTPIGPIDTLKARMSR